LMQTPTAAPAPSAAPTSVSQGQQGQGDNMPPLTAVQKAMFKSMTKALTIQHFGFTHQIILNACNGIPSELNAYLSSPDAAKKYPFKKISYMPFLIKALSVALKEYPILNGCLVGAEEGPTGAKILFRQRHNIGVAMDTPQGYVGYDFLSKII